jgi:hypothetical protein
VVVIIDRLRQAGIGAPLGVLTDVGGEAELYRNAEQVGNSDTLDVAASMLADAWDKVDQKNATVFLLKGLQQTPDPLAFARTVSVIFSHPAVLEKLAGSFNDILLARAASRGNAREAYIAIDAIDGALLLSAYPVVLRVSGCETAGVAGR